MAASAKQKAKYADLEAVPPEFTAEIIDGVLVTSPRGLRPRHGAVLFRLGGMLGAALNRDDENLEKWVFLNRPEVHVDGDVLVPSLGAWRRSRVGDLDAKWADVAPPDFVCEMFSPKVRDPQLSSRMAIYANARIPHLWHVDLSARHLSAFTFSENGYEHKRQYEGALVVSAEPFETASFPLTDLWPFGPSDPSDEPR
jgi:Uma2 family endonuclease